MRVRVRVRLQRVVEVPAARVEARVQVARHALAGPRLRVERRETLLLRVAAARRAQRLTERPRSLLKLTIRRPPVWRDPRLRSREIRSYAYSTSRLLGCVKN